MISSLANTAGLCIVCEMLWEGDVIGKAYMHVSYRGSQGSISIGAHTHVYCHVGLRGKLSHNIKVVILVGVICSRSNNFHHKFARL